MATFKSFEEIEAWQKARALTRQIYDVSGKGKFSRDYGLRDQIRRASVSVMSNIAEGFERGGRKEFSQFLGFASGSVGEVRSQLYVAVDQGYLDKKEGEDLLSTATEISRMITSLIQYLRKQ